MINCAVLGSPIAHSLSPELHRAAYAHLGLDDWHYGRHRVEEAELADFVAGLDDSWRGLSMTKPLKAVAVGLAEPDDQVRLTGAANTMIFEPDGRRSVHNTDIGGLTAAIRAAGIEQTPSVTVLGAGGTTRAALVSVAQLGAARVAVLARRPEQAAELHPLADRLGLRLTALPWEADVSSADLLVSTVTPEAAAGRTELDTPGLTFGAVFDAVYDPWPTPLARLAAARNWPVINGLDLLVHQAVGQLELMTGHRVPAEVLMSAGRRALRARGSA